MRLTLTLALMPLLAYSSDAHALSAVNGSGCIHATIQDAIDAATNGDIIYVEHGPSIIAESLVISKRLTFIAVDDSGFCNTPANWDTVKIEPAAAGDHTATISTSGKVRFQGFAFVNASTFNVFSPGGAIQAVGTDLEFHETTFSNNDGWCGGGIYLEDGTLEITDTVLMNNEAQSGGAICMLRSEATLGAGTNVGAFPNRASTAGGDIFMSASDLELTDDAVVQNGKARSGVTPDGGCIFAGEAAGRRSTISMNDDSIIRQCEGDEGGAIYLYDGDLTMRDDSVLENSHALQQGGLAYVYGEVRMWDRTRMSDGSADGNGGLLYIFGDSFSGEGLNADASIVASDDIVLRDGQSDSSGGCIMSTGGDVSLLGNVKVEGCEAVLDGGGLYLSKSTNYVQSLGATVGNLLNLNRARQGGGIFSYGATLDIGGGEQWSVSGAGDPIGGTRIDGNTAKEAGGGIYLRYDSVLTATYAVFQNNRAVGQPSVGFGGALAIYDGSIAKLTDSAVFANRARMSGGGIYVADGDLEMTAAGNLGDLEADPCPAFLTSDWYCSEVRDNEAGRPNTGVTGVGGGVFVESTGTAEFQHTGFTSNGAKASAPQIFVGGEASATLTNCVVFDADIVDWPATDGVVVDGTADFSSTTSTFGGEGTTIDYGPSTSGVFEGNIVWPDGGVGLGLLANGLNVGDCNVGLGSSTLLGVDNTNADPQFIGTWRGYYRIDASSPAFEHCSAAQAVTPSIDMDFCDRPALNHPDAGAFEWHANLCP